jgi:hypothetical protein
MPATSACEHGKRHLPKPENTRKWETQRTDLRCTQPRLAEKLRRAAGCVEAEDFLRIDVDVRGCRDGDERMQIGNDGDLWRLADCLHEEFADFARVRIAIAIGRGDNRTCWRAAVIFVMGRFAVMVITAMAFVMRMRRAGYDLEAVVMLVAGRQIVQTLAQERNAGVGRQQ